MSKERVQADLTLLLVALIWGSAFVAQRTGNELVNPFTFNGVRFMIGGLVLLPILAWRQKHGLKTTPASHKADIWRKGALLGILLFAGASLQQIGLITTTAGKGGFITGLYVVLVPLLLACFWRSRIHWSNWAGALLALGGLFLLSINTEQDFCLNPGDVWVLLGSFFWALHVIAVGKIAPGQSAIKLATIQYLVCALLCTTTALVWEWGTWSHILKALPAILYAGVLSTGIAYTGQVVAQRHAPAVDAAIILSLEAVFAAIAGWLILNEAMNAQQIGGCILMFLGMLAAQTRDRHSD
jgi:drug/metabolite transporter (DMT)-like permease